MNSGDNPNTNNAIGQHYGATGRGDITISSAYLTLPDFDTATDLRAKPLFSKVGTTFYTKKFFGTSTVDAWVPIFRLAEIILIKAEALARLNAAVADPEAIVLLNTIRSRAGAASLAPLTQTALIDNILTERRIELAFEGQGEFDFLRTKRSVPARGTTAAQEWNSKYVIFPLPFQEVQRNPNMEQNDGY